MAGPAQRFLNGGSAKWLVGLAFGASVVLVRMVYSGVQSQIRETAEVLATVRTQVAAIEAGGWTAEQNREYQSKVDARLTLLLEAVHQNQVSLAHLPPPELLERITVNEQRIKNLEARPLRPRVP